LLCLENYENDRAVELQVVQIREREMEERK
jgi:hypothetical protein